MESLASTPAPREDTLEATHTRMRRESFVTRARAVFWTRLGFLALGIAVLAVPGWGDSYGVRFPEGLFVVGGMLAYGLAAFLSAEHRRGPAINYVALCLDTAILVHLVLASGGLASPLLATQVILASVFAVLFPNPWAVAPAVLALPVVARLDLVAGGSEESALEFLVLIWYAALDAAIVAVVVLLHRREVAHERERARLEDRLRTLAVDEERKRMAREVHDGPGSALAGLALRAEWTERLPDGELRREVGALRHAASECLEELRLAQQRFRGDFDVVSAAAGHLRAIEDRTGTPIWFWIDGSLPRLDPDRAHDLFRVLQETVVNAVRHGNAGWIEVNLRARDGALFLEVVDDGIGFDPAADATGRYGLVGVRERVARCGGTVAIESAPGCGTKILVAIPVPGEE